MKFRKFLSALLFGTGCGLSFIALLAIILPQCSNPQLQLVLASFQMTSEQPVVQGINAFMVFALQQNWRLLYLGLMILAVGGALLLHFTPKTSKEVQKSEVAPPPAEPAEEEKPNPYAGVSYQELFPPSQKEPASAFMLHSEPILERNTIEETETPAFPEEVQPYFSPRLAAESRAIETETGVQSQSGSRILIRNAPEVPAVSVPSEEPEAFPPPAPPSPASTMAAPSLGRTSRIRSTMGRHSSGSTNLPLRHS